MAKNIMRAFRLDEISAVDRPAQAHAKAVIMKREFTDEELGIGKALAAGVAADLNEDGTVMTDDIKKAVDAAVAEVKKEVADKLKETSDKLAAAEKKLAEAECEAVLLKMLPEHRAYMNDAGMNDADKAAFIAKSGADRDAHMAAKPIEKSLPANIQKQLAEAEDMKKRLALLEADKEVALFVKRAEELGCPAVAGEVLRKAYKGDITAIADLEKMIKGLNAQVATGKVFDEFGTSRGGAADAFGAMKALAADLRKTQPALTEAAAFEKVYSDPANMELVQQYKLEKRAKLNAA
jgi:hypothetical protein